jgi:5-methylcytosine-specific restriction protein B
VLLPSSLTFTLRGRTFEKSSEDFVKAVKSLAPSRIQKYSTLIGGKRYPIRQVLAAATKLPAIAITSQDAYRVLERFGFTVDTEE